MKKIILASASPRRRELLANVGVIFQVCPGNSEERITKEIPEEIVEELSLQKAMAVASKFDMEDGTIILGADTIVSFDGKILGKPRNEEEAVNTLMMLQGNTHQVYTGVTVMEQRENLSWKTLTFAECTDVSFYPVSEEEIRAYVATGEPMDKAGAYGIQGRGALFVAHLDGDYFNVMGLPLCRLGQLLNELGVELL